MNNELNNINLKIKHGDYAMHHMNVNSHGVLVRVVKTDKPNQFGCEYVTDTGDSGGSSWSWPESSFKPIVDPLKLAASNVYEARRKIKELQFNLKSAEADLLIREGVLKCITESQNNLGAN